MDFYQVLEVEREATTADIRRSYLKKVVDAHPDKNLDDQEGSAKRFRLLQKAYDVLMNDNSRREYNSYPGRFHREVTDCGAPDDGDNSDNTPPMYQGPSSSSFHSFYNFANFARYHWGFFYEPDADFFDDPYNEGDGYWERYSDSDGEEYDSDYFEQARAEDGGINIGDINSFLGTLDDLVWTEDTTNPQCAYTAISDFFTRLAEDNAKFTTKKKTYPSFGSAHSVFDRSLYTDEERATIDSNVDVFKFYAFWTKFKTAKKFGWMQPYRMWSMNRELQEEARVRFSEVVRVISSVIQDMDPRYQTHLERKKEKGDTVYSASTIKKLDEERQRQKAKKKGRKAKAKKGGKW